MIYFISIFQCINKSIYRNGKKSFKHYDSFYNFIRAFPLGKFVFSGLTALFAPYSSSISPVVETLNLQTCEASLLDRPWLRNPFSSVHALALANLGEFSSGLLMVNLMGYQKDVRGIPVKIETEYYKKARGKILAKGYVEKDDVVVSTSTPDVSVATTTTPVRSCDSSNNYSNKGDSNTQSGKVSSNSKTGSDSAKTSSTTSIDGLVDLSNKNSVRVIADMYDAKGDLVAKCIVTWNLKSKKA